MNENELQYHEIPANTKTVIHAISILPFPVILFVAILFGEGGYSLTQIATIVVVFLICVVVVAFFYYLAGGFDWKPEKLSTIRGLLFFVLSGLIYGLIFYGYWYLVRFVVAKTSKLPFSDLKGKLLIRK
jgi:membrane protein YdbS with pleckstrin-like domain